MGINKFFPAASKFFSDLDHQTPCPPIITGFFAVHASSNIFERSVGSGQAFKIGFGLCENGLS